MKLLDHPPVPRTVRLAGFKPAPYRPKLAQFNLNPNVNVNPNVKVEAPINIDLGGLPLSIGLFAGSGLVFLMRTALPQGWPQTAGLVAGGGLAAAGILNLFKSKAEASTGAPSVPGAPALPPSAAPSSPQGGISAQEVQPSMSQAFDAVTGVLISPQDYSTVNIKPWSSTYPVRIQVSNPSSQPVNFSLELKGDENGSLSPDQMASYVASVSLNPSETKNIDIDMPIVSGHVFDTVSVSLSAYKRRIASEGAQLLSLRSFIVK